MGVIINRVYTRGGDRGQTRLAGGQQVSKTCERIEAYGTLDELNACLGLIAEEAARSLPDSEDGRVLLGQVRRIQNELFDLGGELATLPEDRHPKQPLVTKEDVARLEQELDTANEALPTLRSFVLPGGGMLSAFFHQARTVCRRAERCLIRLNEVEEQRAETIQYVNRLSDWLFVFGRRSAVAFGHEEILWTPGQRA
ncbi:MAG: cob(I)yrinic acid a,c-diamide adenosyltransferase [Myxococcota bacterium]